MELYQIISEKSIYWIGNIQKVIMELDKLSKEYRTVQELIDSKLN
jgi:hypothetical protein